MIDIKHELPDTQSGVFDSHPSKPKHTLTYARKFGSWLVGLVAAPGDEHRWIPESYGDTSSMVQDIKSRFSDTSVYGVMGGLIRTIIENSDVPDTQVIDNALDLAVRLNDAHNAGLPSDTDELLSVESGKLGTAITANEIAAIRQSYGRIAELIGYYLSNEKNIHWLIEQLPNNPRILAFVSIPKDHLVRAVKSNPQVYGTPVLQFAKQYVDAAQTK